MFVNETAYWVNETQPFANETDKQGIPVYDWKFNLILTETEVDETATTADDATTDDTSTDAADTDAPAAAEDRRQLHEDGKFYYHEHLTTPHNHTITDEEGNATIVEFVEEEKEERPPKAPETPWQHADFGPSCGYEGAMLLRLGYLIMFFVYFTGVCCF